MLFLVAAPAHAQLLEDSKSKLKSQKVKREKGFLFFKKKGKTADAPAAGQASSAPRYSKSSAANLFRNAKVRQPRYSAGSNVSQGAGGGAGAPRYSQRQSWSGAKLGGSPRYSGSVSWKGTSVGGSGGRFSRPVSWKGTTVGSGAGKFSRPVSWKGVPGGNTGKYSQPVNWKGSNTGGAPRYSQNVNWKGAAGGNSGKYSQPVNWKGSNTGGAPRYSQSVNWKGSNTGGAPRYSQPVNWKGTPSLGSPRYSQAVNWRGTPMGGNPRYSQPVNWKGTPSLGSPRYSQAVNWKGTPMGGNPRYSQPVNWRGAYMPGSPRYSTFKDRFLVNKRYREQTRPRNDPKMTSYLVGYKFVGPSKKSYHKSNDEIAEYGEYLKLKRPHYKNMHPSVNYLIAKNIPSKLLRKSLRKWSVFWIRLNDGKTDPKGAKNFAKKSKFDKHERNIWEERRDNKPSTRQDSTSQAETPDDSGGN